MKEGDARRLPGYAIAPRGALDSVKRITRGLDGKDIFAKAAYLASDRVIRLSWIHAHGLALEGSSEVSRFRIGNAEFLANKSFMIYLENVRVRKSDLELLAASQKVNIDVTALAEKPADAPKPKKGGRPPDLAEKQRIALAIADAFATVIHIGDDKMLSPPKKNFLDACRRLEMNKTGKTSVFKDTLTADTVADWLRPAGYQFKRGTPTRSNIYTSNLPAIEGKIHRDIFTVVV